MKYFYDELSPGMTFETNGATITEDAIIRFGLEWDFQPFHVDRERARDSMFGELIASGFHTLVLTFRLCNQFGLFTGNALAGIGLDEVRFRRPVPAGTTIRARVTIGDMRPSRSNPDAGVVKWHIETLDQSGETVMSATLVNIIARKPPSER